MHRPVDRTKRSNVKCEHCRHYKTIIVGMEYKPDQCKNVNSPHFKKERYYYNRCKAFEWPDTEAK